MLDLGWQMRHKGLDSEPRKHGFFPLCIPSLFSLGGAHCSVHRLVYISFHFYQRAHSRARILIILRMT